jgi:hypothetical protein
VDEWASSRLTDQIESSSRPVNGLRVSAASEPWGHPCQDGSATCISIQQVPRRQRTVMPHSARLSAGVVAAADRGCGGLATSAAGLQRTCGPARSSGLAPCRPARRYRSRRCRASAGRAVAASMSSAPIRAMNPSPYTPAVKMGTGQEGQAAGYLLLADSGDLLMSRLG